MMRNQRRIRDYGIQIGRLQPGKFNAITDVAGVGVGHVTLSGQAVQTGVTAIIPHQGNLFKEKLIASSHVINGFGKTMGTVQIAEMGTIETPIVLTNTLSAAAAADALIDYSLERNPEIGRTAGTVNPVVGECNDSYLNDIRGKHVKKEHIHQAIERAASEFEEGTAGAGTGMLCYSLKGGIGSASRLMELAHGTYTMGVLVLTNFGLLGDLMVNGKRMGAELENLMGRSHQDKDKGSAMIIAATDLPVSERQLNRILKRSVTGLARTGAFIANGSGEIAIGFSTANRIAHEQNGQLQSLQIIHEEEMDLAFRAIGEAVEESVLNSLVTAEAVEGRDGNSRPALKDLIKSYGLSLV